MAGEWIEWGGGECPVDGDVEVEFRMRGDDPGTELGRACAGILDWSGGADVEWEIVAYRLVTPPSALTSQVAGTHYKECEIQPVQYIEANDLKFLEGCIVKRATRHDKPTGKGREDIEKIIHEAKLILELRYGG
jgi:hypothetical protein